MNDVLKVAANWQVKSLSDVIDRVIMREKNDLIRSLYDTDDWQLILPYTREEVVSKNTNFLFAIRF